MAIDTSKLIAALNDGDDEMVKKELTALIEKSTGPEMDAEALYAVGQLYLELSNAQNEAHLKKLVAIRDSIEELEAGKRKLSEGVKLATTRQSLK